MKRIVLARGPIPEHPTAAEGAAQTATIPMSPIRDESLPPTQSMRPINEAIRRQLSAKIRFPDAPAKPSRVVSRWFWMFANLVVMGWRPYVSRTITATTVLAFGLFTISWMFTGYPLRGQIYQLAGLALIADIAILGVYLLAVLELASFELSDD